jgi:hypothetical protein
MTSLSVAVGAAIALGILAAIAAVVFVRRRTPVVVPRTRRRAFDLEEHVGDLLTGPVHRYGRVFTSYAVWQTEQETRLELVAGDPWRRLNDTARCLVVRYLWQALERIAGAAVVVVDSPTQQWTAETDKQFQDEGWDWLTFPSPWIDGPQYIKE